MPRQAGTFVENSFVKGLITEATGLNFPEQAVTSTDNCVFDERGNVRRRRGIDFEIGYELRAGSRTDKVVASYRWDAAAGDGNNSLVVVQVGSTLLFYLTDSEAVSDNLVDTLDLSPYATNTVAEIEDDECQFAAGKGYLFVANPHMESIYIEYDTTTQQVTANEITLKIRDFEGVDDGLDINERPATLTDLHEYNLMNQGWNTHEVDLNEATGTADTEGYPLTNWEDERTDEPSNADIWWRYNGSSGFQPDLLGFDPMNTAAPKGHYILTYYNQDRDSMTTHEGRTWTGVPSTTSGVNRASTIEFFAGRVWYAGTKGQGYSNQILFSQIIERDAQIGECFQLNDPTAEHLFDLMPSDGGVITIPDSGTVVKLFAFEDAILVFATNGCWKISGSEGVGFRANDYSVVKISSIPCLSESSFVSVDGIPCFWNSEGIYIINSDQGLGTTSLASLTDTTIRTFFNEIPLQSKRDAKGAYNRVTRVISWIYKSTEGATVDERYSFDRILNFNTLSQAFYGYSVDISDVAINSIVVALSRETVSEAQTVVDGSGNLVVDGSASQVYAFTPANVREADITKFICSYVDGATHQLTFADEWSEGYEDWFSYDNIGTAYSSHFVTGYKVHGDGMRKAQPSYIHLYFTTDTYDSSVDFRSLWQYANSGSTGRWSSAQRITTTSNLYDYTKKRIKTRGSGTAYQFRIDSVAGEPFYLIGWAVFETTNSGI